MKLIWYQCVKCETLLKDTSIPHSNGCPSGHQHNWKIIGEVGDRNYLCKKCSLMVQTKEMPHSNGCTSGGQHEWKKF